jgi:hypothetical protein
MSLCRVNKPWSPQPHFVISTVCQSREVSASRGSVLSHIRGRSEIHR